VTYRPSIAERIAWTSGQLGAAAVKVLVALWSCGDYETGRNCRPYKSTLVKRSGLSRATVTRTLARLRDPTQPGGPWIVASPRHRHATSYDIQLDRLATRPPKEQQMTIAAPTLDGTFEAHFEPQAGSEAQSEPQPSRSEAHFEPPTSDPDLVPDVRTHTPRAREADHKSEAHCEPQDLPLVGPTPPPRCTHPHAHAWCEGRVHVPRDLHFEMLGQLGTLPGESATAKAGRLIAFYARTMYHLPPEASIADSYAFWKAAFRAWVETTQARVTVARQRAGIQGSSCFHDPPCRRTQECIDRTIADGRAERARKFGS
jgi:hypothetical protein